MKAIAVEPGAGEPALVERPQPEPDDGEALVRTLRVGVDGTDHEVIAGHHGKVPAGADRLVLGHEAVGVVEDSNGTDLEDGTLVVPTVRRSPTVGSQNDYFGRGEPDMAPEGEYVERGIVGEHGFMMEYFTSPVEYLVPLPEEYASLGFLVEPISISEKALEHAFASRSAFDWTPESALVLGNGSLGLLTLAMLAEVVEFERTYCLGRRDRPDPTIDIIEELGATYVDSRETPVSEIQDEYEPMDFVYEATGYAKHAVETVDALAPNGVGALLGVPESWEFEVDGGRLHQEMVLHNKALVGTVNSHRGHFETAIDTLAHLPDWLTEDLVTGVYDLAEYQKAFETGDDVVKTAVEFTPR
ncbi:glucose 1-dehydrogenase [Natronobacterium gregoryi]|uniref:Glucose 1-dehydrogenase n=2 Tax=Natronobacterium gregoryi TaxID=44930 RepID=L0ABR9_NATGS|nr:glucose 1-dehydrogenase [Natronobacterium gregoryi]AFZ71338.1 theronine dehydrogenase-like Zn-dependent dehydrogenase [Natronobacterium gregoryi SP2]ELY67040.1 molecular chaperone GroES [Natronobacterium gregoryi SP2]PLK18455.1 glucose dehydrogenase [Natronobacterium gregoryi SP2]SFJ70579.1 glucose 1-dehydrogenase [Natronobacterium gregoryi]